jgi:hypothetical protein
MTTNFKKAFYGLGKTQSNELNTIINNVDTLNDNIASYTTDIELTTALTNYVTTATAAAYLTSEDIAGFVTMVAAPASATATGVAGQIAYDATNIYVCVATNTWVKATLATWS